MDLRTRRIWQGLVAYANAANIDVSGLRSTISDCMPWSAAAYSFGLLSSSRLEEEGAEYQPATKTLLLWLCSDPKSRGWDDYRPNALRFLYEHCEHIRVTLGEIPYALDNPEHFEESSKYWEVGGEPRNDSPLQVFTPSRIYKDIADPICDFVLAEYQKYRNGNYKRSVPIFVCANPACEKLVMPHRIGKKKFCSDECKAARHREDVSQSERTDYQWLYRLSKKPMGAKRAVLRSEAGQERLTVIMSRNYGAPCKQLIQELDRFSSQRGGD